MFEGYNLIYICGEGFWTYACDETVTPTLYKMSHNGIVLDNYYNSFLNTTTNKAAARTNRIIRAISISSTVYCDLLFFVGLSIVEF